MSVNKIITADRIFTGENWLDGYAIVIEEGRIKELIPVPEKNSSSAIITFPDCVIVPAFIDLQLYGAYGKLLAVFPDTDCLEKISDYSAAGGAWMSLPTVATNPQAIIFKCIDAIRQYWSEGGKGIGGLHIEGPWINPLKRGAHIESLVHIPSLEEVHEILEYGKGVIRMITMAPEICNQEIVDMVRSYGIICSAGHSNAGYAEAIHAFDHGYTTVTHLYNAMSPLQHRAPGLVGAAMEHERVMASIIPDGYHVDYAAISIAKKVMKDRLFVITDAVTDTTDGYYPHEKKGDKYEAGGILSGSALTMLAAARNLVEHAGIESGEAIRMCSYYPAKVLGLDHEYGLIKPGYYARLLVMDKNFTLKAMID